MHDVGRHGKHRSTVAAGLDEWLGAYIFAAFSFVSAVTAGATANGFCTHESCSANETSSCNALVQFTLRRQSTLTQDAAAIDAAHRIGVAAHAKLYLSCMIILTRL
jgi:hypothetical protein